MSVKSAMLSDFYSVTPETSVEDGLTLLHEKKVRIVPVVDEGGTYHGLFCYRTILGKLLPSGAMEEGGWLENLNFAVSQSEDAIPDKLLEILKLTAADVMDTKRPTLHSETSFWHMLLLIYKHDAPLPVMEEKGSDKIIGIVTKQSSMDILMRRHILD